MNVLMLLTAVYYTRIIPAAPSANGEGLSLFYICQSDDALALTLRPPAA